jgi:hypothetical protein
MPDRQPEPWENSAAGPFCTMRRAHGTVEMWALGEQRFTVKAPGLEQIVVGFEAARLTRSLTSSTRRRRRAEPQPRPQVKPSRLQSRGLVEFDRRT